MGKNKVWSVFACVLAMVLLVSLAACAGGDTSQSAPPPAPQESSPGGEPAGDAPSGPMLPYAGDMITYTGLGGDLQMRDDEESMILKAYREKTGNVKIDWTLLGYPNDLSERISLALNSGDLPDIMWTNNLSTYVNTYRDYGYFLNLADYSEYMPNLTAAIEANPSLNALGGPNGEIYAVTDIHPKDGDWEGFHVNLTNLEKIGAEIPETWDEAVEAMMAYKALEPDSTPFLSYWGGDESIINWTLNGFTDFFYSEADGKWTHPLLDEAGSHYKDTISLMSTMYTNRLMSPDYDTMSTDQKSQILMEGNWLFAYLTGHAIPDYAFKFTEPTYEFDVMLPPAAEAGGPRYDGINFRHDSIPDYGYLVNANVENPELMASLLDNIISPETSVLYNWGIEGVTYEVDETGAKHYTDEYSTLEKRDEAGIMQFSDVRQVGRYDLACLVESYGNQLMQQLYVKLNNQWLGGDIIAKVPPREKPVMSTEAAEQNAQIMTPIDTYIDENVALFINGSRPMDEWDAFVQETLALGDINAVLANYEAGRQFETSKTRDFVVLPEY